MVRVPRDAWGAPEGAQGALGCSGKPQMLGVPQGMLRVGPGCSGSTGMLWVTWDAPGTPRCLGCAGMLGVPQGMFRVV